jgi:hypothetical protein
MARKQYSHFTSFHRLPEFSLAFAARVPSAFGDVCYS